MNTTTRYLCRLLGPYCLIAAAAMATHRDATLQTITALVHDAPLVFFAGVITVLGGLAWILVHNRWSGGGHTLLITVLGWITLLKGLLFLFLPPADAPHFYLDTLHYPQWFYGYAGLSALIGLYLCFGGFGSRAEPAR